MPAEVHRTACNRDCPDACGLLVTVEDGKVTRVGGDPDHPITKGFICYRTSQFPSRHNSPDRLTTPLIRKDGVLTPASWDEALDLVATRLLTIREESGPAAILHYRSGGTLGLVMSVVDYFFELLGPVSVKRGDICSGGGDAAQETDFGDEESHDAFDILNGKTILLWGKNPYVSNVHLLPLLREARKKGTKIVLIDPVRHKTANSVDRTIKPRPGGDFALAMAIARNLLDTGRTDAQAPSFCDHFDAFRGLALSRDVAAWAADADVSLDEVSFLADAFADRPCSIQVGWGMGRRMNGSAIVRALDALCAVSGNLGIPGGGVSFYFKRRGAFDTSFLKKQWPRTLSEPRLGHEILEATDPPVRAVWISAGNPVSMLPEPQSVVQALESRELVVVVDSFVTDTGRRAHVVLPTTTLVEDDDLLGAYGNHWLNASTPAVPLPEGVRSDLSIVQSLARVIDGKTGANGDGIHPKLAGSARDWKRRLLAKVAPHGVTVEELEKRSVRNPLVGNVLFADRTFPTATRRMQLVHALPPSAPEEPGFPLWLFSNSTEKAQSSQWAGPDPEDVVATCHPDAAPGFSDGEAARLESAIGRMDVKLRLDPEQRKDVVVVPKGGHYDRGQCANTLIRARLTDAGEGAAYQDCRVRIVRA